MDINGLFKGSTRYFTYSHFFFSSWVFYITVFFDIAVSLKNQNLNVIGCVCIIKGRITTLSIKKWCIRKWGSVSINNCYFFITKTKEYFCSVCNKINFVLGWYRNHRSLFEWSSRKRWKASSRRPDTRSQWY